MGDIPGPRARDVQEARVLDSSTRGTAPPVPPPGRCHPRPRPVSPPPRSVLHPWSVSRPRGRCHPPLRRVPPPGPVSPLRPGAASPSRRIPLRNRCHPLEPVSVPSPVSPGPALAAPPMADGACPPRVTAASPGPAERVPGDQPRAQASRPLGCVSGTEPSVQCLVPSVPQQRCLSCPGVSSPHRDQGCPSVR
ncbi:uncharacterized protein LOC127462791 [Manacus candei]|uniref:uncharacterized protein LOC127462791 n=1 Tax=Manacus candei TaxID=415023 RepID=UPI002226F4E2|nr:uncharacterized protein LOC127462791 [Manacus candei]